ncbi:type II toxin-antitoxin system VapC family toxin [Lacihabitans soyangensis]|uniref:Type II toxin-antitoxin system VapC family toxin n=1 Tax=Lacihabitans soyangensis TaxID=869394 RepID=A0AAE3H2L6_9BACT|nr:type II toxin-antitoxin system VapC family toxin [Lacihabitans soyangensis]MCP9763768.1 type II toxin-antitoxin system VapC family toxin [Lacihabitans soyangensis]
MNYLIDTQILIWFQLNDSLMKPSILSILNNIENNIFVSDISLFEVSIKSKLGKLPLNLGSLDEIIQVCHLDGFKFLSISQKHIITYQSLQLFDSHRDPFDRLLISTAISEGLTVISTDEKFKLYKSEIDLIEA